LDIYLSQEYDDICNHSYRPHNTHPVLFRHISYNALPLSHLPFRS
jgi:hypothetical protein